jgi:hypothetical protein
MSKQAPPAGLPRRRLQRHAERGCHCITGLYADPTAHRDNLPLPLPLPLLLLVP